MHQHCFSGFPLATNKRVCVYLFLFKGKKKHIFMHTKIALNSAWVPNNDSYLCNIFLHNCPNVLCGWKCGRLMCRFHTVCFALMYGDRAKHRTHHHWKCRTRLFCSYSLLRKWTFNLSPQVHLRWLFLSIRSSPFKVAIKMDNMANNKLINYVHYIMLVCETSLRDAVTVCFKPHEHYNWK